jgi:capsule polysaccharide export protein KpsE/RkpR
MPRFALPPDAYDLLAAVHELAYRLPQLLTQISAFLQRQLQQKLIAIDGGEHTGDPRKAIGTASHQLNREAAVAAQRLAAALDAAQQAIAFASYTGSPSTAAQGPK